MVTRRRAWDRSFPERAGLHTPSPRFRPGGGGAAAGRCGPDPVTEGMGLENEQPGRRRRGGADGGCVT